MNTEARSSETMTIPLMRKNLYTILLYVILIPLAVAFLFPFYWTLVSSVKTAAEVRMIPPTWWPKTIILRNFSEVWSPIFARYFLNSFIYSGLTALIVLFTSSMLGFIIEKYPSKFGDVLFWLIIASMMVPFQTYIIPLFKVLLDIQNITRIRMPNTYQGMIFPWICYPFGIFMLRQAMKSIPDDLIDAARIDGCTTFGIYWRVIVKLVSPNLASLGLLIFMWKYDDLLWPLIVASDEKMYPITMGILQFVGPYWTDYHLYIAASLIAIAPVLMVFIILQRFIIRGIAHEGLKL